MQNVYGELIAMQHEQDALIASAKSGDQSAFVELTKAYEGVIKGIVASQEVNANEKEDLYQEGLIGLYKAAISYDSSKMASFPTFSRVCINHSIISALRKYYSKKNSPMLSPVSIDDEDEAEVIRSLGPVAEPEKLLLEKERRDTVIQVINVRLSPLEKKVLRLFVQGMTYGEISEKLGLSPKSVDNAIQRIRGKLKSFIQA